MSQRSLYRAPAVSGQILEVPPRSDYGELIRRNIGVIDASPAEIAGIPLGEFRSRAIAEAVQAARDYHASLGETVAEVRSNQLLIAGHQPELFHPGVWIKNFALNQLAGRHGLTALNLIVDTDLVKSSTISVPRALGEGYSSVPVPFDVQPNGAIYESSLVRNADCFRSFPRRVKKILPDGRDCLLPHFWPETPGNLGDALCAARRHWERQWGCHNLEVPISRIAETPSFRRFVKAVLGDLPNFRGIYNRAVRNYRAKYKLRSKNHPVPELGERAGALETPFWQVDAESSTRQSYFHDAKEPTSLRPKALMTTLYARLFLGVAFIHGIGGGKYDEVTDEIIERWLGTTAPEFGVVSATAHLPLDWADVSPSTYPTAWRLHRDLQWNPQRFAGDGGEAARKRELIAAEPVAKEQRRHWFRDLQAVTAKLREPLQDEISRNDDALKAIRKRLAMQKIARSREYSWVLFPEETLKPMMNPTS